MNKDKDIKKVLNRLSHWDQKLDFQNPVKKNVDIKAYLNYYGLNFQDVDLHFGNIEIDETEIIVQIFKTKESKGIIFILHGYLNHVGHLKHIIQYLTKHNYTVISYDLQGHGLSNGKRASIESFSDYVVTLEKLMKKSRDELEGPFYVMGHSTGGAIAINYVLQNPLHHFDKVILVAPLIRSNYWLLTRIGYSLANSFPFINKLKMYIQKNSANKTHMNFTKRDPLQLNTVPLAWLKALMKWNEEISTYNPVNTETLVIQGNKDTTIDWKYNVKFITEKFNNLQIVQIDEGKHELLNESRQIRAALFSAILRFLKE
ncbi:alpha/beta hydrolase [Halobacillus seohaensis]|uniref:Alpha/beta hydrolase n=1 Tax=Halobacillus seohaensis TaxID=447421 RepID=A0ABW2EIV3_9BACI